MPAYLVAVVRVDDGAAMRQYVKVVRPLVAKHGGRYLVPAAPVSSLEGPVEDGSVAAIVEFPSMEAARAFYDDDDYAPMRDLRLASASSTVILFEARA